MQRGLRSALHVCLLKSSMRRAVDAGSILTFSKAGIEGLQILSHFSSMLWAVAIHFGINVKKTTINAAIAVCFMSAKSL